MANTTSIGAFEAEGVTFAVPLLIIPAVVLFLAVLTVALMPIGLVQRYRAGTARRAVRGWIAGLNVGLLLFSAPLFLTGAAITNLWVPSALTYSLAGFAGGGALGILGLALTRWDEESGKIYYTPNRWLVLLITIVVTARLGYGFWRMWRGWRMDAVDRAWLVDSGIPGSLAVGALVLGYSLAYWTALWRRARRLPA